MEKRKSTLWSSKNSLLFLILLVGILLISVGMFYSSFALLEPIESVIFSSENLNFENREPGAWQIKKSARWVSSGKAQVTLDLNSVLVDSPSNVDIILALDVSSTMSGERLDVLKESVLQLINTLLENPENRVALITFSSSSTICSYLTNDIAALTDLVNSLTASGDTNYYDALVNVDLVLQNSDREDGKNCTVVFLTDGYPLEYNYSFAVSYSNYLKNAYPGLIIQGISYELDGSPVGQLKNIANHVYYAKTNNLYKILFEATIISENYDEFIITDFIDTNYFNVEHVSSSGGSILNNKENIKWNVRSTGRSYFQTGSAAQLTIDLSVKEEHLNDIVFPVGEKTIISSKLNGTLENVESSETPVLRNIYTVTYDMNILNECSTIAFPEPVDYKVFDKVEVLDSVFSCGEYYFKNWEIISDKEVEMKNGMFIMPENDVTIRAIWGKTSLTKSMTGDIYVAPPSVMQSAVSDEIWEYKDSITKVVFQKGFSDVGTIARQFDLSDANDNSIIAKMVSTGSSTYTVYIQAENGIQANPNSSSFFNEFRKLERIEGIEIVDTSEVIDMSYMFGWCESLKSLNLQNFNTSKVTTMLNMFRDNTHLEYLDVTSFDTSNVTNMQWMFGGTSRLSDLDLRNFNTSKVTDMTAMFAGTGVVSLDLSSFDTSKVETMRVMFSNANNLIYLNLDPIKFSTLNVINMSNMFNNCFNLSTSIVIRNENISSSNFASMFSRAATVDGTAIIVNYVSSNTQAIAENMISTKSSDAHILLGEKVDDQIPKLVSIVGNNDIRSINNVYGYSKLISISGKYQIVSFAVNGVSYTSKNYFYIPFEGAEITDIVVEEIGVMQSAASKIYSLSNIMYDRRVYEGATSLQVAVEEQFTYTTTRYLELYDSDNNLVCKNPTGIFTIPGNTIRTKFEFGSDKSGTTSYSYKITITPIYE